MVCIAVGSLVLHLNMAPTMKKLCLFILSIYYVLIRSYHVAPRFSLLVYLKKCKQSIRLKR